MPETMDNAKSEVENSFADSSRMIDIAERAWVISINVWTKKNKNPIDINSSDFG